MKYEWWWISDIIDDLPRIVEGSWSLVQTAGWKLPDSFGIPPFLDINDPQYGSRIPELIINQLTLRKDLVSKASRVVFYWHLASCMSCCFRGSTRRSQLERVAWTPTIAARSWLLPFPNGFHQAAGPLVSLPLDITRWWKNPQSPSKKASFSKKASSVNKKKRISEYCPALISFLGSYFFSWSPSRKDKPSLHVHGPLHFQGGCSRSHGWRHLHFIGNGINIVLLGKIDGPVWYTIYHHLPVVKGVVSTPSINQATNGKRTSMNGMSQWWANDELMMMILSIYLRT